LRNEFGKPNKSAPILKERREDERKEKTPDGAGAVGSGL
jgi:hypothetical protein